MLIATQLTAGRLGGGTVIGQQHGHSKERTLVERSTIQLVGLGEGRGRVQSEGEE